MSTHILTAGLSGIKGFGLAGGFWLPVSGGDGGVLAVDSASGDR